uniref:Ovule protein n=1 Tax=Caenorhabditis tropicalis TaxID=1561998 RepID=A0A1I7TSK6_9PELO
MYQQLFLKSLKTPNKCFPILTKSLSSGSNSKLKIQSSGAFQSIYRILFVYLCSSIAHFYFRMTNYS